MLPEENHDIYAKITTQEHLNETIGKSTCSVTGCIGSIGTILIHYMLNWRVKISTIHLYVLSRASSLNNMKDLENDESHIFVYMKIRGLTRLLTGE